MKLLPMLCARLVTIVETSLLKSPQKVFCSSSLPLTAYGHSVQSTLRVLESLLRLLTDLPGQIGLFLGNGLQHVHVSSLATDEVRPNRYLVSVQSP